MESYSAKAVLSVVDRGFTSKMEKAVKLLDEMEGGSRKASKSMMDIAKGAGVFKAIEIAVNGMKASLGDAIDRFDTMERYPKVMQQMGFSAESSEKSIQKLSDGIKGLPTSLDGIVSSTQKIAVLTRNLDKATDTSLALNNAFLASGAVTADAERGLTQYVQMLSKGTVDMQSWRTLQETMGYALSETAKELGIASGNSLELYSAIQSGTITFNAFNDALIECSTRTGGFADKAKVTSSGIKTSFSNLGIAVTRGMANTIQAVDETSRKLDGAGIADKIDSASKAIDSFFEGTASGAAIAVQALDIFGPSLAAVLAGYLTLQTAVKAKDTWLTIQEGGKKAKDTLETLVNAEKLAAEAAAARETATKAAAKAAELSAVANEASVRSMEAETIARESSVAAIKTKTLAEEAAKAETKVRNAEEQLSVATLKLKAAEERATASATKSKAIQEKAAAAVTKARASVDKKAIALETAKAKAEKIGATSAELCAKAETMDAAATKASSKANEKAITASMAKATAERVETKAAELNAAAEAKEAMAEEAGNVVTAKSSMLIIAKTAAVGVLSGSMSVAEAAQWAWNAAMAANPIGAVIVTITALTAVMVGLSRAIGKLDTKSQELAETHRKAVESSDALVESLDSSKKAYEENTSEIETNAEANKKLLGKITALSQKESRSTQEKAELAAYVDSLNSSMEGLNLQYDAEADSLNMTTEAIRKKVAAYEAQAKAQAVQERYLEVVKEQIKVEEEQATLADKRNQYEREWQELNNTGPKAMGQYNEAMAEMNEQEEALNQKKQELASTEEYLTGVMAENQQAQASAVASGVDAQKISLEDLSETQAAVVQSLNETWQSYADQATNMFDTLSDKSELSVADMTANLLENQRVIGDWATNIETLAQRGIDEGLLEQLRQAGPESAGYVNAMVQASDTELQALSEAFANGGKTATDALKTVFDTSTVPESAMNLITKTQETLNEQILSADFASLGKNVGQGLGNGISESAVLASTASGEMAQSVNDTAANVLGVHSPSTVFQGYGVNVIEGLALGLQSGSGRLNAVMTSMMQSAGQAAMTAMSNAFSSMVSMSVPAFNKIPAAARVSMNQTATVVKTGMGTINSTVKADLMEMSVNASSGMTKFQQAVNKGMQSSRMSVASEGARMLAVVSSLQTGFYSSGYYASRGLANGINAGAPAAIAAANRLANQVATTMNKALKVGSPSRVTRRIGGFTTEGFVLGILDDINNVKQASVLVAEAAIPAGGIAKRVASAGAYTPYPAYDSIDSADATYTIIVPLTCEGREIARATAIYTKEELDRMEKRDNRKHGRRQAHV